ncbi:MAG: CotH kinase family protein [Clostridia bacterium]|nr:CotH kinase family protein [Clostridia bacterium]
MKKITAILLAAATLFALAACDFSDPDDVFETSGTGTGAQTTVGTGTDGETLPPVETLVRPNKNGLMLSEVMASNKSTVTDDYGEYSDWIELYNSGSSEISLKNYILTDNPENRTKGILPDVKLGAGEYIIIWASGRNVYNEQTNSIHLPFKLSKTGEIVSLLTQGGNEIGRITIPENAPSDISAAPADDGHTVLLAEPTPGEGNVTALYEKKQSTDEPLNMTDKTVNTIRINEYATKKCVTFTDEEGDYGAWVEIYNYGEKEVKLKGLYLSDDESDTMKWTFPDVTLQPDGYLTVFMLGKDKEYTGGELHASFTLSGKETSLGIYNGKGDAMDSCTVYKLESNITCGRSADDPEKWLFFPRATRNAKNDVPGFDDIESARHPAYKTAYISEVVAVNATLDSSPDGKTYSSGELYDYYKLYDFVEIKNPTDTDIELSDLYIGKSTFEKAIWLPTVKVKAGSYRIVYFADETTYDSKKDAVYVDLGLNRYGNDVYLFDKNGTVVDSITTGLLFDKTSAGRVSDTDDTVYYFTQVTPGAKNSTVTYSKSVGTPSFSENGGYVEAGTTVTIKAPEGCLVYYTTDGTPPTQTGTLYRAPITVDKTMSIRARAYRSDSLPSDEVSVSFIVGRVHNMPVVFLNADPNDLFSEKTGIWADGPNFDTESMKYDDSSLNGSQKEDLFFKDAPKANYWQSWERPVSFTYIDENGTQVLNFNAGIKTFGQYSRVHDQKSVSINLKDKYGIKEIVYPFFGDDYINVFSNLVLRGSGQDANRSHIRDAFIARALLGKINCEVMNYRPVVVYVNGDYYGIYDLRERISDEFVANHTGADPDNLDRMKGSSIVQSGTSENYNALYKFVTTKNMADADNYAYVCSQMDIDNYIDYWIAQIYFANTDPGNIKFYRERTDGGKWRWIPYDFDWSCGSEENRFNYVFKQEKKIYGIIQHLIKNSTFKKKFISRFCELLNDTLSPDRLLPLLRELTNEISEEMEYHIARWNFRNKNDDRYISDILMSAPASMTRWEARIESVENWLRTRDTIVIGHMKSYFGLSDSDLRSYGLKI